MMSVSKIGIIADIFKGIKLTAAAAVWSVGEFPEDFFWRHFLELLNGADDNSTNSTRPQT